MLIRKDETKEISVRQGNLLRMLLEGPQFPKQAARVIICILFSIYPRLSSEEINNVTTNSDSICAEKLSPLSSGISKYVVVL